jgi:D-serine deaminase-like pyridoxal phosphate-dependent protein
MLQITEPTLLLDETRCRANIRRMAEKAARSNVRFRPHFKTHQSLAIGEWFRDEGVEAITVSSVKMADYFSTSWRDITIAVPFNILETGRINRINPACALNLCVMYTDTLDYLEANLERDVGIYIKIDVGYKRTGLDSDDPRVGSIVERLQQPGKLSFRGFLGHAGHSYNASSKEEILEIDSQARAIMKKLRLRYEVQCPSLEISLGDTPCCSIAEDFTGMTEARPGNAVFYDLTQHGIGSCSLGDIAVAMACPVIARHEEKLIIHGGGVHFSKDSITDENGRTCYGKVVGSQGDDWSQGWGETLSGLEVTALSQEHGTITGPSELLDTYSVGDLVLVLPVHSCMTSNEMKIYTTLSGERLLHLEADYPLTI